MEIEKIEDEYRKALAKHKTPDAPDIFWRLHFELLLEIAKDLKTFRDDYQYQNGRGI